MYCTFALLCCCKHLHNIAWFNFLGKDEDCSEQCGVRSGVRGIALSFIELNCTWSFIELNWEQEVEVRSVCNSASLCTASVSAILCTASVSTVLHQCEVLSCVSVCNWEALHPPVDCASFSASHLHLYCGTVKSCHCCTFPPFCGSDISLLLF